MRVKLHGLLLSATPFLWTPADPMSSRMGDGESVGRELTVDVDLSERRLVVSVDGREVASYDVAVGKPGHQTPTGTYQLSQVVWNPSWVPPDSKWADTAEAKKPGERGNPMGRVKILFESTLYIHGTTDKESLGEPASHGCIRMSNAAAMRVARLVMEYGGASRSDEWYASVKEKPAESFEVAIPNPPVLRIQR
jgi:murein L,D-transpeptidase YcbB/YkuD